MRLKSINLIILSLFFLLLLACNGLNPVNFFYSSPVDERYKMKNSLKNYTACTVADTNNYSFLVVADTHYNDIQPNYFQEIQRKKDQWGISFIVMAGDIVHNGYQSAYDIAEDDFANCTLPIYPIIGNHDLINDGFDIYQNLFGRTIYEFKIGSTQFIILDSANGTLGSYQKEWLENILKDTDADKIIILTHYNLTDNEFLSYNEWSSPEERYYLIDLFDTYDVDYYICGHMHFNDEKEIRGVKYIAIKNLSSNDSDVYLKVTVNSSGINAYLL